MHFYLVSRALRANLITATRGGWNGKVTSEGGGKGGRDEDGWKNEKEKGGVREREREKEDRM